MLKTFLLIVFFFSFSELLLAQGPGVDPKLADLKFKNGNYEEALADYLVLLKDNARSEEYNYRIGICYLNTNINKAKAIPYIENVIKREQYDNNALYLLGRSYQYAYRFDDAMRAYSRFKDVEKGTPENIKDVERQLQYCFNAKELVKYPVDVSFDNLGKNINSPYPDYYPFVSSDETFMVFNSKRAEGDAIQKADGCYSPSAYKSIIKEGLFSQAKNLSSLLDLPDGEEEVIGLSPNGKIMLMCHDDFKGLYNIYMLTADSADNYSNPIKLNETVNSKNHEISACINNEGDILYFASDRPGGLGGTDIYVARRLPSGEWGIPQNLGEPVNSAANEDFPNLSPDGKMLFFSSDGHTSMGGYDIFKVIKDEKTSKWVGLKNIGYPINTPSDNMNFRVSRNGRYGYISSLRAGGQGDLDVYRVTFNDVEHNYIVIRGTVSVRDQTYAKKFSPKKVTIKAIDESTKEVIGTYMPHPINGRYIVIVPPGNYTIVMSHDGFVENAQSIKIPEKIIYDTEIEKNFTLEHDPKWFPPSVTIKNIDTKSPSDSTIIVPKTPADSTIIGK